MAYSLIWLPDVLKDAGLKVAIIDGWESRGRGDVGHIYGVICHHTAGGKNGNMPSLGTIREGRPAVPARPGHKAMPALPGPLAQLGLGRDGTYYVIAAGRCNHAGKGVWRGMTNGNANFIGIEAENTGENEGVKDDFPWPEVQMEAYHHGVAAILRHINQGVEFCAGHKEYARRVGRKDDPDFDMNTFRSSVSAILNGTVPAPIPIPAVEPLTSAGAAGRPTLRRDAKGDLVKWVQSKISVDNDGAFGPKTEAALRKFQHAQNLVPDGIVGPKTWAALDKCKA
jgi:peptidoglycan hydrolase-like protein with peptidoglycan-binding domain